LTDQSAAWRVTWYPRLLLAGLLVAFVIVVFAGSGGETVSGRLGGDYPAFYGAGELAIDDPDDLYEPAAQAAAQADLFEEDGDPGFLYFAYPPYVALGYAPLAALPYRLSYVIQTIGMVGALVLGLALLRPLLPWLDRRFEPVVIGSLFFYPMLVAVTAGQNTAITFLLIAGVLRALADDRDLLGGLAIAALLYKPQFAALFVAVALIRRRWRMLLVGAGGAAALYLVGAAVQGFGWVGPWLDQAQWFNELDAEVNAANAISWLGVAEATWGVGSSLARAVGGLLALATVLLVLWIWWQRDELTLPQLGAITVPAVILASPHAMFYDAGLLVVPMVVLASEDWATRWRPLLAIFLLSLLHGVGSVDYTILFPITIAVFAWALHEWVGIPPRVRETISPSAE
jgi:hypothetical protein